MIESLLAVSAIEAGYGAARVLHGVDLVLGPGEAVAVVGPNGAGKSTLLNLLSGIVRARAGTVTFRGESITNAPSSRIVRHGIVHVPEGRQVFPEMTVRENLELGAFSKPQGSDERLEAVLHTFPRLRERLQQDAQTLSGGEQQMLAIGRGLMADPAVLLLDEPTLGLAPILVDALLERLLAVREQFSAALLVVEQNAYLASELCDRYAVLLNGVVTETGDSMPEDPDHFMAAFMGAPAERTASIPVTTVSTEES